jgi:hypothetical protein
MGQLLNKRVDVRRQSGGYDSAFYTASADGQKQIVKVLLDKYADVNVHGGCYGSGLYAA